MRAAYERLRGRYNRGVQRLPPVLLAAALSTACRSDDQPCWYTSFDFRDGSAVETYEDLAEYDGECVVIAGTLTVRGREIGDLTGLEGVVGITGSLRLTAPSLASTNGMEGLEFVGGGVRVSDSYALERVTFPSLETIGDVLIMERLPRLVTLDGFPVLDEVGGDVTLRELDALTVARLPPWSYIGGSLRVEDNELLDSVLEPGTLFEIGSYLEISQNHRLRVVDGFGSLQWLRDDIRIVATDWDPSPSSPFHPPTTTRAPERGAVGDLIVTGTRSLEEVTGFEQIHATKSVSIKSNERLRRVVGFATQAGDEQVLSDLWVHDNPELSQLPALTGTIGYMTLENNDSLTSLADLEDARVHRVDLEANAGLRSLAGLNLADGWQELCIVDNEALENLHGLGIAPPGAWWGGLRVLRNGTLSDISALEPMTVHPPTQAIIADNPRLPQPQAASLAERLGTMEGKAAGNLGWELPASCPWEDGICDEHPVYGVVLCPEGSDQEDCGS